VTEVSVSLTTSPCVDMFEGGKPSVHNSRFLQWTWKRMLSKDLKTMSVLDELTATCLVSLWLDSDTKRHTYIWVTSRWAWSVASGTQVDPQSGEVM
jgi:hypothetical protein